MTKTMQQKKRWFRLNQMVTILLVLSLVVALAMFAKKYHYRSDWTESSQYTLSDQTKKVISQLTEPVSIIGFFQKEDAQRQVFKDLMASYRYLSEQVSYKEVNPDQNPHLAKEYGIREYGTIYIEHGTAHAQTTEHTEEAITNAIIGLIQGTHKKIAILSGHGEKSISDTDGTGFSVLAQELEKAQYKVDVLSLFEHAAVPEDVDLLILSAATNALLPGEMEILTQHLSKKGARVLFLLDPGAEASVSALLAPFHIQPTGAVIIDPMSRLFGGDFAVPIVSEYPPHPITDHFTVATFFPLAQALGADSVDTPEWTITPIAKTQPSAWGEKGSLKGEVAYTDGEDLAGPLVIAYAIESKTTSAPSNATDEGKTRIVVVGDSDFISNAYYDSSGNNDFFKNIVHWLTSEENLISIHPKAKTKGELSLSPAQGKWLFIVLVIAVPLLFLLLAVRMWRKRRRQ